MILVNSAFADSNSISTKYDDNLQITLKWKAYTWKYVNDSLIRSLNKSLIWKNDSDKINWIKSIILKIDWVILKLSAINNTNRNNLISVLQNMKNYYNEQINELTQKIKDEQSKEIPSTAMQNWMDNRWSYQSWWIWWTWAFDTAKAQSDYNSMTKEEQKVYTYNKYWVYDWITKQEAINNIIKQWEAKNTKSAESLVKQLIKDDWLIVK